MSGLSIGVTGLDTETIIQELMKVERQPLAAMQTKQQNLAGLKAAWDTIRERLEGLASKLAPLCSSLEFQQKAVTVSDNSVLSATVNGTIAEPGMYEIEVISLAKAQIVGSGFFADRDLALNLEGVLVLNGKEVYLEASDTLADIASKVNGAEGIGVRAAVLQVTAEHAQIVLTAETPGSSGQIDFGGDHDLLKGIGFFGENNVVNQIRAAQDGVFLINGVQFVRSQNQIDDVIAGITVTLASAANPATGAGGSCTVTVELDDQSIVDNVKAFVKEYNSLIDVTKKYGAWDSELKSGGLMFGDPLLQRLVGEIRNLVFRRAGGPQELQFVGQIGISTGTRDSFSRDGKLTLDENKLTETLKNERGDVAKLFGASGEAPGIFGLMREAVRRYTSADGFLPSRKAQIEAQDKDLSRQIEAKQRSLDARLLALRRQFSGLEIMLSRMNSQGTWLSQQIAGM